MATVSILSKSILDQNGSENAIRENGGGHNQEILLASLMEKLEMTSKQIKAWSETSRKLRAAMAKYTDTDPVDPGRLQKCLDNLKRAINVSSLPAMVERLESIAKPLNLNVTTTPDGPIFISYDYFYVEVVMGDNGKVTDVKLALYGDPVKCPEMCDTLQRNDFKEFAEHLKGLSDLDQTSGDMNSKTKALASLTALEADLNTLFQYSNNPGNSPLTHVKTGLVGYYTPRVGGRHTKLTFFVSPYDLLDLERKQEKEIGPNECLPKGLGLWATIALESASPRKLQSIPLITVTPATENKPVMTQYAQITSQNSSTLSAVFALTLNKAMPLPLCLIRHLQASVGVTAPGINVSAAIPIMSLICHYTLDSNFQENQTRDPIGRNQTLTYDVSLTDQKHRYFMNDPAFEMQGLLVSKLHFTQPSALVQAINCLRQQAIYNALVASCVRKDHHDDWLEAITFEVTAYTYQKMTVIFEHPAKDGMACVEFDVEGKEPSCRVYGKEGEDPFCSDEYATKVLRKCLSIPVTMRAILKKAEGWLETRKQREVPAAANPSSGTLNSAGNNNAPSSGFSVKQKLSSSFSSPSSVSSKNATRMADRRASLPKSISDLTDLKRLFVQSTQNQGGEHPSGVMDKSGGFIDNSKVTQNPMLASLLQSTSIHGGGPRAKSMLPAGDVQQQQQAGPTQQQVAAALQQKHTAKNPMLMTLLQESDIEAVPASSAQEKPRPKGRKRGRPPSLERTMRMHSEEEPSPLSYDRSNSQDQFPFPNPLSSMPLLSETNRGMLPRQQSFPTSLPKMPLPIPTPLKSVPLSRELPLIIEKSPEAQRIPPKKSKRSESTSSNSGIPVPSPSPKQSPRQSPKTPSSSNPTTPTHIRASRSIPSTPEHTLADTPLLSLMTELLPKAPIPAPEPLSTIDTHSNLFSPDNTQKTTSALPSSEPDPFDFNEDIIQINVPNFDDMFANSDFDLPGINSAIARMDEGRDADPSLLLELDANKRAGLDVSTPLSASSHVVPRPFSTEHLSTLTSNRAVDLSKPLSQKTSSDPSVTEKDQVQPSGSRSSSNIKQSKGKPRNFAKESGMTPPPESPSQKGKRRSKKVVKTTEGTASEALQQKPKQKRGRKRKKDLKRPDSDSSPESNSREDYQISIESSNEPLKMKIKVKPFLEQKKSKPSPPATKIKLKVPVMPTVDSDSSEDDEGSEASTPVPTPTHTPKDEIKEFLPKGEGVTQTAQDPLHNKEVQEIRKEKLSSEKLVRKEKSESSEKVPLKKEGDTTKAVEKLKSLEGKGGRVEDKPSPKPGSLGKQSSQKMGVMKSSKSRTDIQGRKVLQGGNLKQKVQSKQNPASILQGVLLSRPVNSLPRIPKLSKAGPPKDPQKMGPGGDAQPVESPKKTPPPGSAFNKIGPGQQDPKSVNKKPFNPMTQRQRSVSPSVRPDSERKGDHRNSVFTKPSFSQKGTVSPRGSGPPQPLFPTGVTRSPSMGERRSTEKRSESVSPSRSSPGQKVSGSSPGQKMSGSSPNQRMSGSSPSQKISGSSPSRPAYSPSHPSKAGYSSGSSPVAKFSSSSSPSQIAKATSSPSYSQKTSSPLNTSKSAASTPRPVSSAATPLAPLSIPPSTRASTPSPTIKGSTSSSGTSSTTGPRLKSPIKGRKSGSLLSIVSKLNEKVQSKEKPQDVSAAGQKGDISEEKTVDDSRVGGGQKSEREGIFEGISAATQSSNVKDEEKSDEVLNDLIEKGLIEKTVSKSSIATGGGPSTPKTPKDEGHASGSDAGSQSESANDSQKDVTSKSKGSLNQTSSSTPEIEKRSSSPKTTAAKQAVNPSKNSSLVAKSAASPKTSQSLTKSGVDVAVVGNKAVSKTSTSKPSTVTTSKSQLGQEKSSATTSNNLVSVSEKTGTNKPQLNVSGKASSLGQAKAVSPVTNRPIILSKSSSLMTSPEKGATKVTRVQIAPSTGHPPPKPRPPTPTSGGVKKRAPVVYERNQSTDSKDKKTKDGPKPKQAAPTKPQLDASKGEKDSTVSTRPDESKISSKGEGEAKKTEKAGVSDVPKQVKTVDKEKENQMELMKASLAQKLAALKRTTTHDSSEDASRKTPKLIKSETKVAPKSGNASSQKPAQPQKATSQAIPSKPVQQPLKVTTPKPSALVKDSPSPQGTKVAPPQAKPSSSVHSPQVPKLKSPSPLPKYEQAEFKVPSPVIIPSSPRTLQNVSSPSQLSIKPSSPTKALSPISPGVPSPVGGGTGGVPSPQAHKRAATPEETVVPAKRSKILDSCSPVSPAGSEDDALLSDLPQSPCLKKKVALISGKSVEGEGKSLKEAALPSPKPTQSPLGLVSSPVDGSYASPSASPCGIDDDLMNEALSSVRKDS